MRKRWGWNSLGIHSNLILSQEEEEEEEPEDEDNVNSFALNANMLQANSAAVAQAPDLPKPSQVGLSPRIKNLARHRIRSILNLTDLRKSQKSEEPASSRGSTATDRESSPPEPQGFTHFTSSIAYAPDKPRAIDRRLQRIRMENEAARKSQKHRKIVPRAPVMNLAGSTPLQWSEKFGQRGRRHRAMKERLRLESIKEFKSESQIFFEILKGLVVDTCKFVLANLLVAAELVDQSKQSLKGSALNMAASVFMVKAKGGRLFPDDALQRFQFYATTLSPPPEEAFQETAFVSVLRFMKHVPNQRPIEELPNLILWILQDMDEGLKTMCPSILEGFISHVESIQRICTSYAETSMERRADSTKKNSKEFEDFAALQRWYEEKALDTPKIRSVNAASRLEPSALLSRSKDHASTSSLKKMGSTSSLRSSGSTASIASLTRSPSSAYDVYKLTDAILTDGLRPPRKVIRTGMKNIEKNYQLHLGQSKVVDVGSKTPGTATTALDGKRKIRGPKIELTPTLQLTHTSMNLFLQRLGWKASEDSRRTVGITVFSNFITEKVNAEAKKLQFAFFVSQEKLIEMKRAKPDPISSHCSFKVKRKANDSISALAPPKVNSKQRSMVFLAVFSDAARTVMVRQMLFIAVS